MKRCQRAMRHRSFRFVLPLALCVVLVSACKKIEEPGAGQVPPQRQQQPAEPAAPAIETQAAAEAGDAHGRPVLPPLFKDIAMRTFQFIAAATNENTGMTPDRFPSRPFASIASIGFALTAYPIGVENGWVS